jgi:hypothetical protein
MLEFILEIALEGILALTTNLAASFVVSIWEDWRQGSASLQIFP